MSSTRTHRKTRLDSVSSLKRGDPATRQRICEAALRLIVKRAGVDIPLADVARAARVSRQALYLHFKDRAALFLAVAQHADDKRGLPEAIRRLQQAPTGLDALRYMAATRATLNSEIWPLARILDSVRREDPAAAITLQNRRVARLGACRMIVDQLARDGSLRADLERNDRRGSVVGAHVASHVGRPCARPWVDRRAVPRAPRLHAAANAHEHCGARHIERFKTARRTASIAAAQSSAWSHLRSKGRDRPQ